MSAAESRIDVEGLDWAVHLEDFDTDDAQGIKKVVLSKPDEIELVSIDQILGLFSAGCQAVHSNGEEIYGQWHEENASQRILDIRSGDQSVFPYPVRFRVEEDACVGAFGFFMPTRTEPYSKHEPDLEINSVVHSWGLSGPEITFASGTSGKSMKVEYTLLRKIGRPVKDIPAPALCVHALANLERRQRVFGFSVDPSNYPRVDVEIIEPIVAGWIVNARRVVGSVSFEQSDGLCTQVVERE